MSSSTGTNPNRNLSLGKLGRCVGLNSNFSGSTSLSASTADFSYNHDIAMSDFSLEILQSGTTIVGDSTPGPSGTIHYIRALDTGTGNRWAGRIGHEMNYEPPYNNPYLIQNFAFFALFAYPSSNLTYESNAITGSITVNNQANSFDDITLYHYVYDDADPSLDSKFATVVTRTVTIQAGGGGGMGMG